ncbi:MAG: prolipoprotein diacylglyceryl transferase [Candidatus Gracilibacteria bacterium]|jgi:phosphatidylglycerol:prolipoprotein diacylglycerol transferase|nr:prolipoprotein diacylglyceryl transferase [Candidatus Gracilibacteria bacterium]
MHPILFQTNSITIYTFWLFFGIAVIAGTYTLIKLSKIYNLKIQFLSDNVLLIILISLLGARIVSIIENYQNYFYELSLQNILSTLYIWDKGLNPWGAILAFLILFYFLCKKNGQSFSKWMDILTPSIIIIIAITSLGAFFDGINYGKETNLPWGVNFESPTIKYTVPIHPTQIYAFIYNIAISIFLIVLGQSRKIKEKTRQGFITLLGIIIFAFFRFLEEFMRGDDTWLLLGIRLPQIFAGLTILVAGIFLVKKYTSPEILLNKESNNQKND